MHNSSTASVTRIKDPDTCSLLLRNRRGQQRIGQVRPGPVEDPVRDFLQRHAGADDTESPGGVLDRQRPQRHPGGILAVLLPPGPPPQEPVPYGILRNLQGNRPAGVLQLVHHHIPVRRQGMGRQVPRRRNGDLPMPALVQVRRAHVRMVQDRPAVRERINVIGHAENLLEWLLGENLWYDLVGIDELTLKLMDYRQIGFCEDVMQ